MRWHVVQFSSESKFRDAWKECESMDTEAAEAAYIELVQEVSPEWSASS